VGGILLLAFVIFWRLINFADRNPQAALLEGAEFIIHEQIVHASKYLPSIPKELAVHESAEPTEALEDCKGSLTFLSKKFNRLKMEEKSNGLLLPHFIQPRVGVTDDSVKGIMNLAIDWYQYSEYCWVVKTTSDAKKWQSRLNPLFYPGGNLLIIKNSIPLTPRLDGKKASGSG